MIARITRFGKAIVAAFGTVGAAYLSRYGDHIWPIVLAFLATVVGTVVVPNRLSSTDIRWQRNFWATVKPYLSNVPPVYGSGAPPSNVTPVDRGDPTD